MNRILIVEDQPSIQEDLRYLLEECGSVDLLPGGREVLAACRRAHLDAAPYTLILLNIMLPDMSGFEVCRQLKAEKATAEIPVIFVTGRSSIEDEQAGFACGAVDYITKPINPPLVLARVKTHLALRSAYEMLQQQNGSLIEQQLQLRMASESRQAISRLLATVLEPISLEEQLQTVLRIIFSVSWFNLQPRGAIFLLDPASGELVLSAHQGLDNSHQASCARLQPGRCLCGKAFASKKLLFSPHVDEQHEILLENMPPHGHYCVPILENTQCLGVINLYLATDHRPQPGEEAFLTTVAHTVAGLLKHRHLEKQLDQQAKFDVLTGLPNRFLFHDRLHQALAMATRNHRDVVLIFIDLDQFKLVNDTVGHEAGDRLLQEAGQRITSCLRGSDTVARLGGDEFTIILQELTNPFYVELVARKILEQLARPFHLLGEEFSVSGSMGITFFPHDAKDAESLLKNADSAMYQAKKAGRSTFCFFTQEMQNQAMLRMQMERELLHALEKGEFCLHYQAKVESQSGRIVGMEALVRWEKPGHGLVSPGTFIPLAEETGFIVPLGAWILQTACQQNKEWLEANHPPVRVAVNLSARQFQQGEALIDTVASVLSVTELPAEFLELEVTESMVMENVEQAIATLQALRGMGLHLSLDDFGTGYSSLGVLKRFPLHALKIDRSFVTDLPGDPEDCAIVSAIISLAHKMNLAVIAEGVETADQLEFLRDNACNEIQGYYFSRPLPAEAFERLLRANRPLCPTARPGA
ncbi:MAG: EAL domain-containing protein [Magnetococcus sp. MYC-9]